MKSAGPANAVQLQILGREYRVACPEGEESALHASADYLGRQMREIRDSGKVMGVERIAVMAGLNITHELLNERHIRQSISGELGPRLKALHTEVREALNKAQDYEL